MKILIAIVIVIAVLFIAALLSTRNKKRAAGKLFESFTNAIVEAADEGERAYRAQIESLSLSTGRLIDPSIRGIALARLLCASFPAAAFAGASAGSSPQSLVNRFAPYQASQVFQLASGAALKPMKISRDHPLYDQIKSDTDEAIKAFFGYFNGGFKLDPISDLVEAELQLAPQWKKALELSAGPVRDQNYTKQFCTSGLDIFLVWFRALSK